MPNINKIESWRDERAKAFEDMKSVLERADDAGNLSAEDTAEFDKREADFDRLTASIERAEKLEGIGPSIKRAEIVNGEVRHIDEQEDRQEPSTGSDEYRSAFESYVRGGLNRLDVEQRAALQVGTDSEGGYTVADDWVKQLIEAMREFGTIEGLCTHFQTGESGRVYVPSLNTRATAALTAEEAAFTESEDTFSEVQFDSYKVGVIMKVSDELLNDSIFDIAGLMARSAGEAIGIKANNYFVVGTGSGQPNGVVTASTLGKTAAGAAAITTDEIIDLYHSLLSPYRRNAAFLAKDSTVALIRKLKTSDNQYIWQPGLQAGQPDVLLGRPLYVDPDMPAATTGLKSVLFGDFSKYWVRDVGSIATKRLEELYAANGQVGLRVDRRIDGDLVDTSAVKHLIQA